MPDASLAEALHHIANYFSSYFSYFFAVLFDNKLLGFISYLGIILTIYYSLRSPRKSIRYAVAQKGNEYVIAFWNSCRRPIFKEDVFALCLFVDGYFECRKVFQDNYEAPFELSVSESYILYDKQLDAEFDSPVFRIDLSFDFLNKRRGYIVLVSSDQKSAYPFTTLSIYGKLRGEPPTSVLRVKRNFPLDWFESFQFLFSELFRTVLFVFSCSLIIYSGIVTSRHTETWIGTILLILFLILTFIEASSLRSSKMPFRMRSIYKRFLHSDFKEIRPQRVRSNSYFY
ncbi:MAG: hypothetical protein HDT15_04435 [Oscillibacter sp.]|nr:hypothetical protein [Oscillibacter sp.]